MSHKHLCLAILFYSLCTPTQAKNLLETLMGQDINQSEALKAHAISVGGWAALGGTYTTANPSNHNNNPITFNDRSGELQLNQLNVFAQKSVDADASNFNVGGKLELLFGTDSRFTQATGLDNKLISENDLRFYDLAIPQAYCEVFAPVGKGLSAKIGHFYTIIGQEVVTAPNNFFYSHSYAMQYGEPFTHTGVLFNYVLNNNFTLNAGSVTGWDNFDRQLSNWNFLGNLSWANDDATTSVAWSVISGDVEAAKSDNRTLSSLLLSHSFSDNLYYTLQQDFGVQQRASLSHANATWYGINQYLRYNLNDSVSLGLRGEWFRDNNGVRLKTNTAGNYFALTAGANWQAMDWLKLRPEVRYDWSDNRQAMYINQTAKQQLSFALDLIITF